MTISRRAKDSLDRGGRPAPDPAHDEAEFAAWAAVGRTLSNLSKFVFGGDPERTFVCEFSRGAIACSYIGLADDEIASLWRG